MNRSAFRFIRSCASLAALALALMPAGCKGDGAYMNSDYRDAQLRELQDEPTTDQGTATPAGGPEDRWGLPRNTPGNQPR